MKRCMPLSSALGKISLLCLSSEAVLLEMLGAPGN
jgi:hypothetical protein